LNRGPWRFDNVFTAIPSNRLLHISSPNRRLSLTATPAVIPAIEYPRHLWDIQSANDNPTRSEPQQLEESFSISTSQSVVASSSESLPTQIASNGTRAPLDSPPTQIMESVDTPQAMSRAEFAWTFASQDAVEHVKKINNGSFGEVHMVRPAVSGVFSDLIDAQHRDR
jgi:hypothetical protein